jgi:tetratricopeptide (TPR) repeat protein
LNALTLENRRRLLSLTFNNLGCYYKKKEKPNVALFYLNKSLELEMLDPRSEQLNLAGTHLNLTAILTKLGKHNEAINHAKSSIIILRRLIDRKENGITK